MPEARDQEVIDRLIRDQLKKSNKTVTCAGFDHDLATAYIEQVLSQKEQDQYQEHLATCHSCRQIFTQYYLFVEQETVTSEKLPVLQTFREKFFGWVFQPAVRWSLPIAASLLIAAAVWLVGTDNSTEVTLSKQSPSQAGTFDSQEKTLSKESSKEADGTSDNEARATRRAEPSKLPSVVAPAKPEAPKEADNLAKSKAPKTEVVSEKLERKEVESESKDLSASSNTSEVVEIATQNLEKNQDTSGARTTNSSQAPVTAAAPQPSTPASRQQSGERGSLREKNSLSQNSEQSEQKSDKAMKLEITDDTSLKGEAKRQDKKREEADRGRSGSDPKPTDNQANKKYQSFKLPVTDSKKENSKEKQELVKVVADKRFIYTDNIWTDEEYLKNRKDFPVVDLVHDTEEYRKALQEVPVLKQYVGVGKRVLILYKEKLYSIHEK